ncbi:hypothetical protein EZ428_03365 [Pedobacter frigiditerrae]|uniref:FAD dependent oxidoreductase n=1 Tax=Pedobacter frigiditerrae TaxID=2530452 RepID=A0A4R0N386_9SPHI|nr:hypothetical protein [Pedobacter frigiditerrae]TCC93823.1 hypothetical protein EZ428_03365 [Pedobacter frigiditerrae]
MIKKIFLVLILVNLFSNADAQKTAVKKVKEEPFVAKVLVIGNGNAALAAAVQSAVSGVKTSILLQAGGFDLSPVEEGLSSGIQTKFLKKYKEFLMEKDSTKVVPFDKQKANASLNVWVDSIKNLSIIKNVMWVKAERSGKNWVFKLSDGSTIRPKVLINPADAKLNEALKIIAPSANWNKLDYNQTLYRTSVASGKLENGNTATIFSMYQLLLKEQENLVWINDPESMSLGQAAGATAAYAAFFDLKTSESNLKKIQGELINYKLDLMPFGDIKQPDTNWKAIQFVGVTGILKAEIDGKSAKFSPNKLVTTEEIRQPIKDFYYKAQIWFDDYKNSIMTIGSSLDMISYVGNKSLESMKKEIPKKWKTSYQFKTEFDLERQINRRELAVLLQDYMPPFNVNVDEKGKVVR